MKTYLLTWNPKYKSADTEDWFRKSVRRLASQRKVESTWSTGMNRSVEPGDQVFLLRQGTNCPGLVGYGYVRGKSFKGRHWDPTKRKMGGKANYCEVSWLSMVDVAAGIPRDRLLPRLLPESFVNTQQSGREIPAQAAAKLKRAWAHQLGETLSIPSVRGRPVVSNAPGLAYADQYSCGSLKEPKKSRKTIFSFYRIRGVRLSTLVRSEGRCEFCGKSGILLPDGRLFLETHHVVPLSRKGRDHVMNVIALCPNDHREAHYGARADELEKKFKELLRSKYRKGRKL
jgi:5-methylcytosine-specific restriction endonuclease McrA